MASTAPTRARRSPLRVGARLIAYLLAAWGTLVLLTRGLFPGATIATLAVALYTTLPLLAYIRWRGWPFYPGARFRLFVVRPFWYAQLVLPVVSAAGLLGLVAGLPFGHALTAGRAAAGVMLATMLVVLALGYLGSRKLVVRHVDANVRSLPPELDGLRIAQLSDLHIGPHTSRRFLARVMAATSALDPHLVAITGDLVDDRAEDVPLFARAVRSLHAPLGLYLIPGNHDVYAGWDEVERALRASHVGTLLVNESAIVHVGEATLALVGTGDPAGGRLGSSRVAPDVERALSAVPPDATTIAFAHNPALWPSLAERGVALTLSGHTHWGQLALPSLGWSLASPFLEHAMGAHVETDAVLYISPGTGYWGIPFRLGASPEVTLVTLHGAESSGAEVHQARVQRRRWFKRRAA